MSTDCKHAHVHVCHHCNATLLLFPLSTFLQATHENLYKYSATEDYFGDEKDQSFALTVYFKMFCESSEIFSRILFLYAIACTKIKA